MKKIKVKLNMNIIRDNLKENDFITVNYFIEYLFEDIRGIRPKITENSNNVYDLVDSIFLFLKKINFFYLIFYEKYFKEINKFMSSILKKRKENNFVNNKINNIITSRINIKTEKRIKKKIYIMK